MAFCENCGAAADGKFCRKCGAEQKNMNASVQGEASYTFAGTRAKTINERIEELKSQPLPCPVCGQHTDSLREHSVVLPSLGYVFFSVHSMISCSSCFKTFLKEKLLVTFFTSLIIFYPINLIIMGLAASMGDAKGHSRSVLKKIAKEEGY